jgi:hypothetical protein
MWQGVLVKAPEDSTELAEAIVQRLTEIEEGGTISDLHFLAREGGIYVFYRFQEKKPQLGKVTRSEEADTERRRKSSDGLWLSRNDSKETSDLGPYTTAQTFDGHRG